MKFEIFNFIILTAKNYAMKKLHLIALCAMIVSGCAKEPMPDQSEPPDEGRTKSRYLSMDSLQTLAVSLPELFAEGPATRSGEKPMIADIAPMSDFVRGAATRSGDGIDDAKATENIYVVNYDNQQGFAILSADTRMETILAYADQGNITDTMDNPGVHMFMEMLPVYATLRIDPDIWDSLPDEQKYPAQTEIFDRREYSTVGPYLFGAKWSQEDPLNSVIFETSPYPICPDRDHGHPPVGCVTTAMIGIMTANNHPVYLLENANYYDLNWVEWRNTVNLSPLAKRALGEVAAAIGKSADISYNCKETSTTNKKADYVFRNRFDYNTDGIYSYHIDRVMEDLTRHQAVFISGFATSNWIGYSDGHAWVIDGYKDTYKINKIYNNFYDASHNLIRQEYAGEHKFLDTRWLHCNWGWGGEGNGYYSVGVFNTEYPQEIDSDCIPKLSDQVHFRFKLEVIKNIRPK